MMQDFLMNYYDGLRALHVIAIIAWMAGLLYLPRLFVYHTIHVAQADNVAMLKTMERRLLKFIMNPASIASWLFGGAMLYANPALLSSGGWMHVKLTCVVLMTGVHHMMAADVKRFAQDRNTKSTKFYRILNEVPTVLMIVIVFMVILKPF